MTTWQNNPGGGYYPGQQGYPGPQPEAYPGAGFQPPPYSQGPPAPGFIPPPVAPAFGHVPTPQAGMYGTNYDDGGQDEVKGFQFNDLSIRQAFIKKVYSILMLQLLLTFGVVAFFTFNEGGKEFARKNQVLMFVCLGITLVIALSMACCTNVRRKAPINFIFLFIFTLAESVILGFVAGVSKEQHVISAVGITAVICFALTIFAFQTKYDFTGMGTYLFVATIVLLLFGLIAIIWTSKISSMIYGVLGALLFSFYLVYDTQMMLGGKHKYSLSPEEYIFAALNLYLDIINIFLYVLSLLNASRD